GKANAIILTHNFDFFRTVQDRILANRFTNSYMAMKEKEKISLVSLRYRYISNPFNKWKENLNNGAMLIASVAFARNIAEYIGDDLNQDRLTTILHIKPAKPQLTVKQLEGIYKTIFRNMESIIL